MTRHSIDLNQLDEMIGSKQTCEPSSAAEFLDPITIRDYSPPEGLVLVGENHIVRGSPFVIGGAPGVGKSRASVALAVAGATGQPWFGLTVHRKFKTLILQAENGRLRLRDEFSELPCEALKDFIRISPPPPFGFAFESPAFCDALKVVCEEWSPEVFLIDPWNAAARDDKASDYLATFRAIRSILPNGDNTPAIGIVAHTRKPKHEERTNGRSLINLLAGSYVLASVPRSVFVLQAASDEPEDGRVVFTCAKNNDGPLGHTSAWERRNGLFVPVTDFDWDEFKAGCNATEKRRALSLEAIAGVFQSGTARITKKRAIELLQEQTGCGQSAAYNALSATGRFGTHLREDQGFLVWVP